MAFDADWEANGHMEARGRAGPRLVRGPPDRRADRRRAAAPRPHARSSSARSRRPTPPLADRTVLLYGHLDKQPEMTGWRDGLGPWTPVIEGDRLYGRGGADDGYAAFASLLAIEAAQAEGIAARPLLVLIEASEESGSPDLPAHVEALADRHRLARAGVCLDSGCLDDERLWVTTSLRGLAGGSSRVEVLTEGVHSRRGQRRRAVELPPAPPAPRPRSRTAPTGERPAARAARRDPGRPRGRARADTAASLEHAVGDDFPFAGATRPMTDDPAEQLLARTLAADAELHRRRRLPADEPGRQRAAPVDVAAA